MEASTAAAFVAAGVALVVGLLGPVLAARTTRQTLSHQRQLATDERLWHRRAETYEALLRWAGTTRAIGTSEAELEDRALMRRTADELKMPVELHSKMTAHASGMVFASAKHFLEGVRNFLYLTADWLDAAPSLTPSQQESFEEACTAAAAYSDRLADRMAQLVSDDLHGVLPNDSGRVPLPTSEP